MRQKRDDPAPPPVEAAPAPEIAPPAPAVAPSPMRWRGAVVTMFLVAGCCLLARPLLSRHRAAQAAATQADSARAVFTDADGPCRRAAELPCRGSIAALVALRDHSDAALLLGDFRVARYLQACPGGPALEARWRQDGFSGEELMALGEQTRRQHLLVYRSFWMYANVKENHIPVPTLAINNDPPPF